MQQNSNEYADVKRGAMDEMFVRNMQVEAPIHSTVGSVTTANAGAPQGEVMKLTLAALEGDGSRRAEPVVGRHLREAVALVNDWRKNP